METPPRLCWNLPFSSSSFSGVQSRLRLHDRARAFSSSSINYKKAIWSRNILNIQHPIRTAPVRSSYLFLVLMLPTAIVRPLFAINMGWWRWRLGGAVMMRPAVVARVMMTLSKMSRWICWRCRHISCVIALATWCTQFVWVWHCRSWCWWIPHGLFVRRIFLCAQHRAVKLSKDKMTRQQTVQKLHSIVLQHTPGTGPGRRLNPSLRVEDENPWMGP